MFNFLDNMKFKRHEKKVIYFNEDPVLVKQNHILKSFISISMEKNSIYNACFKIFTILKHDYNIDYCTLLLQEDSSLEIAYSDVDQSMQGRLKSFILRNLPKEDTLKIFETEGNRDLFYETAEKRHIKYADIMLLKSKDSLIGVLLIEKTDKKDIKILEEEAFTVIIETLTLSIENLLLLEKIRNMAIKDQLTKVYNRRYLYDEFIHSIDNSYSLAMMDIDHFKTVNDTYGHDAGDEVLKAISKCFVDNVMHLGTVFRFGGEEFLVYMGKRSKKECQELLEKLRLGVEQSNIMYDEKSIKITISIGVADNRNLLSFDDIKKNADAALYKAKENGRNRIVFAD